MSGRPLPVAALAVAGALGAAPLALAQLDVAGLLDVFRIDADDIAVGLRVLAAVGGVLTCCVIVATLVGAALALTGSAAARPVLLVCAIAGFLTALLPWLPAGLAIGAAAALLDDRRTGRRRGAHSPRQACLPRR